MEIIWETVDRLGRIVALSNAGWIHICSRHEDMVGHQQDIRTALELADEVVRDAKYAHRQVHYLRRPPSLRWLRVVVQYRPSEPADWRGTVITAHFLSIRPRNEVLLWPLPSPS
ncbi:MAG: hypothetical protein M3Q50_01205 [Chloroflexota bacterium]|nr:hypothetical protein [Chloroflexota bacterium]